MSHPKDSSPARILIIWDDNDFRDVFLYLLKPPDYFVEVATSCDAGLAMIVNTRPDLLIVSRMIEYKNKGFEFCQQIRSDPKIPYFPIIVGWVDAGFDLDMDQGCQRAYQVGANACFGRVFDPTDVIELIDTLLHNPKLNNLVDRQTAYLAQRKKGMQHK